MSIDEPVAAPDHHEAPGSAPAADPEASRGPVRTLAEQVGAFDPVIEREMRERMRTRPGMALSLYLGIILLVAWLIHGAANAGGGDPTRLGRPMFEVLLGAQLFAVVFVVPASVSGALAGERERDTLVPLQVTLLRPWRIVVGKAAAGVAFLALLLTASLPLVMLAYLLGGVSLTQIALGTVTVGFVGVVLACTTVACSARARSTQTATVGAYLVVLLLFLGPAIASALWAVMTDTGEPGRRVPVALVLPEPVLFIGAVVGSEGEGFETTDDYGPFSGFARVVDEVMLGPRWQQQFDVMPAPAIGDQWQPQVVEPPAERDISGGRRRFALMSGALLTSVAGLSLWGAIRAVRTPKASDR